MSSKLPLIQRRVADLIIADTTIFCDAADPIDGRVPVVVDLPGDIDAEVDKALGAAGIVVIVWQASFGPIVEGETSKQRRYEVRVWVRENVVLNRAVAGAIIAEECVERIDDLVDSKWNGITPQAGVKNGLIHLVDGGAHELKLGEGQPNTWELEFQTNINRRA